VRIAKEIARWRNLLRDANIRTAPTTGVR
jgi:hypothetical protein